MAPLAISGYVLAGGKSSRMGRDKALLELDGHPLVEHAVRKLRTFCSDVHILSSQPELEIFAPLVADIHPGCGPLGGIETALLHATHAWSIFLPVDMPFLEADYLAQWAAGVIAARDARLALFTVGTRPQPTLCMLHRELTPFVASAMARGEFKLNPVLEGAAQSLVTDKRLTIDTVFLNRQVPEGDMFTNLNTPEEFALGRQRWKAETLPTGSAS
ncbi:molybdenum cofactor guanylyltransferase [Granulicella arctica]|uniref:molybdenum cofactor guanylyltransferase n=1 Tax=Granulicella arctica TaxID=940613 RepID=UPI0021E09580|nr:molybdenum cofactor guanylyltransferase [Granulicella arctica]